MVYDSSGNIVSGIDSIFLPPGTYGNILCYIDFDNSNGLNTGDKYQIISGPHELTLYEDSKTFNVGNWLTY